MISAGTPQVRRILLKVGGELFLDNLKVELLLQELRSIRNTGVEVILVHGGGPQISECLLRLGIQPHFIDGQRVTDEETLRCTVMVLLGVIQAPFVARANAVGLSAIGLHGGDRGLLQVIPAAQKWGRVGEITEVRPAILNELLSTGALPVIAPLGSDSSGSLYNINADIAAGALASALAVDLYMVLTNVAGIYRDISDPQSRIERLTLGELESLRKQGILHSGMIPKGEGICTALHGTFGKKVPRGMIVGGEQLEGLLLEGISGRCRGTEVVTE